MHFIFWGWALIRGWAVIRINTVYIKNPAPKNFYAFLVVFNDLSLNGFKINYDCDKILKSDWLSAALISSFL